MDGRRWAAVISSGAYTAVDKAESEVGEAWLVNAVAPAIGLTSRPVERELERLVSSALAAECRPALRPPTSRLSNPGVLARLEASGARIPWPHYRGRPIARALGLLPKRASALMRNSAARLNGRTRRDSCMSLERSSSLGHDGRRRKRIGSSRLNGGGELARCLVADQRWSTKGVQRLGRLGHGASRHPRFGPHPLKRAAHQRSPGLLGLEGPVMTRDCASSAGDALLVERPVRIQEIRTRTADEGLDALSSFSSSKRFEIADRLAPHLVKSGGLGNCAVDGHPDLPCRRAILVAPARKLNEKTSNFNEKSWSR